MKFVKPPTTKIIGKVLKRYDYAGKNLVLVFEDHEWRCFSVNDSGEITSLDVVDSSELDIPINRLLDLGICQHEKSNLERLRAIREYIDEQLEYAENEE